MLQLVDDDLSALHRHMQDAARRAGVGPELEPTEVELRRMVESALEASVMADEGRYPTFTLLFAPPGACRGCIVTEATDLAPGAIAALAPAAKLPTMIGVDRSQAGSLQVWGLATNPVAGTQIRCYGPLRVIVGLGSEALAIYRGFGRRLVLHRGSADQDYGLGRVHVAYLLAGCVSPNSGFGARFARGVVLRHVVEAVRNRRHGGTLLIGPDESPFVPTDLTPRHRVQSASLLGPFLSHLEDELPAAENGTKEVLRSNAFLWKITNGPSEEIAAPLVAPLAAVGWLCGVDGAVVLNGSLDLLAFGATITASPPYHKIRRISIADELAGDRPDLVEIASLGGTRRQSAARFVWAHPDWIAVVASQDGALSIVSRQSDDPASGDSEEDNPPIVLTDVEMMLD